MTLKMSNMHLKFQETNVLFQNLKHKNDTELLGLRTQM